MISAAAIAGIVMIVPLCCVAACCGNKRSGNIAGNAGDGSGGGGDGEGCGGDGDD